MTLDALIKKLEKIRETCGPRTIVCVDLTEFRFVHPPLTHWKIHNVDTETIPWGMDEDRLKANGEERMRHVVCIA